MKISPWVIVGGGLLVGMLILITVYSFQAKQPVSHDMNKDMTLPDRSSVINEWYAPLVPLQLGSSKLEASVADTDNERQRGLSGTPYLPDGVVKLFVFDTNDIWSFWMPDMNYPIDIVWLNEEKTVVHIASEVKPESYPTSFAPPVPTRYVIETQSGFIAKNGIVLGDKGVW